MQVELKGTCKKLIAVKRPAYSSIKIPISYTELAHSGFECANKYGGGFKFRYL